LTTFVGKREGEKLRPDLIGEVKGINAERKVRPKNRPVRKDEG